MKQMTANDIANMVEKEPYHTNLNRITIANFIRQQQAEIEALKAGKIRAYNNGVEDGRKPDTNLVKELTDEEIWELHQEHIDEVTCGHSMKTVGFIEFARAILRKAQKNG